MQISARVDYGVRAMLALTGVGDDSSLTAGVPRQISQTLSAQELATMQGIPAKFLEAILTQLRKAGLLVSTRGPAGGFSLAKPAHDITIAEIIRVLDGPLASIHGLAPEDAEYSGSATHLRDVWVALRVSMREVLEMVSLTDIADNQLPPTVLELLNRNGAWERR